MAVEFTSYGYDTLPGEGLGELVWQEMHPQIGAAVYGVRSPDDWKVTPVTGADRTVSIGAGRGWGLGVIDKTVANDTIQLDPITSGSRWDLICCRRDPTPSAGVSSFIKINGGATPVIPGGRLSGPGIHDQPLALVQVTAGQTQPTAVRDLRTWANNGGVYAKDHLVLSYLNTVGTRISIDGAEWIRKLGANYTPEWYGLQWDRGINLGLPTDISSMYAGWVRPYTAGNRRPRVWSTDGMTAHMTGLVQYNSSSAGANIAGIPIEFAPNDNASTLTYLGTVQASNGSADPANGATIELGIENGILKIVYQSKALAVGSLVPVHATWRIWD